MILVCGNGQLWLDLYLNYAVPGTTDVCADDQPTPHKQGHLTTWLRGSRINLPAGANATADWLKAANCRRAYDEVITTSTLGPSEIAWWESVLPAIGSNDGAGPTSQVLIYVAGNPFASNVNRFLTAAKANPKVFLGVEGYHQGSIYATMNDLRADELSWKTALLAQNFPMNRVVYGISASDAPQYVGSNPAYCSASTLARDADEEAIVEWMTAGCLHLFVWVPYSTERSRAMAGDAIYRGLRRRYGVAP